MPSHGSVSLCVLLLPLLAGSACCAATVVMPAARQGDAGYTLACDALVAALRDGGRDALAAWLAPDGALPAGDVIAVGRRKGIAAAAWRPPKPEAFRIVPLSLPGRRALLVEGDERGTMHGLFRLAERVRLGDDPWKVKMESSPAFPLRIFSEEGQLLDIPDVGYYSDTPPYVNEAILRKEIEQAKQLLRHVAAHGFNTFAFLHLNVEEYIDYRHLDKPVYPPGDRHRLRSPVFCKWLKELCDYAHALHLDIYMQVYEIQFPPRLHELYGVTLDGPHIERIIATRYRELFERVPLDGMIITATETHPRCGYRAKRLWKNRAEAARMATLYHNACKAAGKKCVFRLWRIAADSKGFEEIARQAPPDATFAVKNTGGDYFLSSGLTSVVTSGAPRRQPLVVLFDTFREFDGWSRLFIYMKRWGKIVRACRDHGVVGINAWGPWSPGCIWPDSKSGYLPTLETPTVSWRGHWSQFRTFLGGFTPGQANVYLLGRLAWEPDADPAALAREFAALHLGPANAQAAADALLATEDAFAEEYVRRAHPCYIRWTMIFRANPKQMEQAYKANPLDDILASNARALAAVGRMEKAFARVDPAKAPNHETCAAFKTGIDKTALYLRTFYAWREGWWRHRAARDLKAEAGAANAAALRKVKAQLKTLFDQWQRFPEEAAYWRVTFRYGRPAHPPDKAFPYWFPRGDHLTMEATAESFGD